MKLIASLVLRAVPGGGKLDPVVLANVSDVNQFGFSEKGHTKELILSAARTIASTTPNGQRQSVERDEYMVHCYNRNGLCGLAFVDTDYPRRIAFSVIDKVLDEYTEQFGSSWQVQTSDKIEPWPYLVEALQRYQNPTKADKLFKIQQDFAETKAIMYKILDDVITRGENLHEPLVAKGTDLRAASQLFYHEARRRNQSRCSIL